MNIRRLIITGTLLATLSGVPTLDTALSQEVVPKEETSDQRLERRIEELMQLPDQNAVLESYVSQGFVQQVQYDSTHQQTNFRELVYQENTEPQNKKPVLAFFYTRNNSQSTENKTIQEGSQRAAILFGLLSEQMHNEIKFVAYDLRINSECVETERVVRFPREVNNECIISVPRLALYNIFDLARKETTQENDGRIKKIDDVRGSLKTNQQTMQLIKDFPVWWIRPNVFAQSNPDNDGILYRFMGTGDYKPVSNSSFNQR